MICWICKPRSRPSDRTTLVRPISELNHAHRCNEPGIGRDGARVGRSPPVDRGRFRPTGDRLRSDGRLPFPPPLPQPHPLPAMAHHIARDMAYSAIGGSSGEGSAVPRRTTSAPASAFDLRRQSSATRMYRDPPIVFSDAPPAGSAANWVSFPCCQIL